MAFVEDHTLITGNKFQLLMSFCVKDIASQTWSEISHFVILCYVCGQVSR